MSIGRCAVFLVPVGLFLIAARVSADTGSGLVGLASAVTLGRGVGVWPGGRVFDRVAAWPALRASMALTTVC